MGRGEWRTAAPNSNEVLAKPRSRKAGCEKFGFFAFDKSNKRRCGDPHRKISAGSRRTSKRKTKCPKRRPGGGRDEPGSFTRVAGDRISNGPSAAKYRGTSSSVMGAGCCCCCCLIDRQFTELLFLEGPFFVAGRRRREILRLLPRRGGGGGRQDDSPGDASELVDFCVDRRGFPPPP